jgi:steroid delta-isomerase-like uncharacterized protein
MSSSSVAGVARRFIQAWNAGQRHVVDDLAAPTLTVSYTHFPEVLDGPEAFKEMLAQTHRWFPDLTIDVHEVVPDDNRAVVRWTYQGTFRQGQMFGVAADGQSVEVHGMTRYQVEDGRVQSGWGIVDNLGLMAQLGALPASEQA